MLWTAPDHYAGYQDLSNTLFGDSDIDKIENRLAKAVDRLRKQLQGIPEWDIENIPHQGYRIVCKNKNTSAHKG